MSSQPQMQKTWSRRWMALRDAVVSGTDSQIAPGSARKLRVKRLEVQPGVIHARVVDADMVDCTVEMRAPRLSDEQWQRVIDLIANQALLSAQLLAGQVPPELESLLATVKLSLAPAAAEMTHHCTCPEVGPLCAPVQEVYRAVAELLDDDAWPLFQLRGRSRQEILDALRERRHTSASSSTELVSDHEAGFAARQPVETAAHPDDSSAPGLASQLVNYWGSAKLLEDFHYRFAPPRIGLALLRRLGPPPFADDGATVYDTVAAVHRRVSEEALALAYAAEPVERTDAAT